MPSLPTLCPPARPPAPPTVSTVAPEPVSSTPGCVTATPTALMAATSSAVPQVTSLWFKTPCFCHINKCNYPEVVYGFKHFYFFDNSQRFCDSGSGAHPGLSSAAAPWPLQLCSVHVSQTVSLHPWLAALWWTGPLPGRLRWSWLPWVSLWNDTRRLKRKLQDLRFRFLLSPSIYWPALQTLGCSKCLPELIFLRSSGFSVSALSAVNCEFIVLDHLTKGLLTF